MRATAAILLALLVTGCARFAPGGGASTEPSQAPQPPDVMGSWVLQRGTHDGVAIHVPAGDRVTIRFGPDDEVGGQACNHYGGTYELADDGTISLSAMSMTEMACAEPMMSVEAVYHAALAGITRVERDGDTLTLRGDTAELVYGLLPEVPDAALQDTRWALESLVIGDAVSSVQGAPTLQLGSDGSLSGSTGCRDFSGTYTIVGDQVTMTQLEMSGECTAELEAQDRHVVEVLEGGFMVAIDGDRLTLGLVNGDGLDYRAMER